MLWSWSWTQQNNLFSWHCNSWGITKLSLQKLKHSMKIWTFCCDLDLKNSNLFTRQSGIWLCTFHINTNNSQVLIIGALAVTLTVKKATHSFFAHSDVWWFITKGSAAQKISSEETIKMWNLAVTLTFNMSVLYLHWTLWPIMIYHESKLIGEYRKLRCNIKWQHNVLHLLKANEPLINLFCPIITNRVNMVYKWLKNI